MMRWKNHSDIIYRKCKTEENEPIVMYLTFNDFTEFQGDEKHPLALRSLFSLSVDHRLKHELHQIWKDFK